MTRYRQRKSPRLQGYDYSQAGAYFVTICTHERQHLFGHIDNGVMMPSVWGNIAAECWQRIPAHYPDVDLDGFVVMPNHVHGLLWLRGTSTFKTLLGRVMNSYKGAVTAQIRQQEPGLVVWQSRYHDHIIRNNADLNRIRVYIEQNPVLWTEDTFYEGTPV